MERRRFLALGGAAALSGGLAGCIDGSSTPPARAPSAQPPRGVEWDGLGRQLQGQLLLPGHPDFDRVRLAANARYDTQAPLAVACCAGAPDVAAALMFARQQEIAFTVRSGGHSYLGASSVGGLLVDVGPMDTVQIDGERATVGAGAKLSDVYEALITAGRCIPSGSCVSVGIAGITLGGGFGVLDRAYGLTCDSLRSALVVTADGQQLDCSESKLPDLFWALRGGGGGQVGVVTSLTFETHTIGQLTQFWARFEEDDLPAVLRAWQSWPQTLPDRIWSQLLLWPGGLSVTAIAVGDADFGHPHWSALLARIDRTPADSKIQGRSYRDVMLEGCATLSNAQCHLASQNPSGALERVAMAASSDFFDAPLDNAGIAALGKAILERRDGLRSGMVQMNLMGGAIGRIGPAATAFPHRRSLMSAQYLALFEAGTAAAVLDEAATWSHNMREVMEPWSSGGAYVNYLDGLLERPAEAYYGSNLARLRQVKQKYDPAGLFKAVPALT